MEEETGRLKEEKEEEREKEQEEEENGFNERNRNNEVTTLNANSILAKEERWAAD